MNSSVPPAVQFREICASQFGKRKLGEAFKSMLRSAKSGVLGGLGTEQVGQVLGTALSIRVICDSNASVADMLRFFSKRRNCISRTLSPGANFSFT